MAAQCWLRGPPASLLQQHHHQHHNHHHHHQPSQQTFVSSNAYYGYVPVARNTDPTVLPNDTAPVNLDNAGMDVDVEDDCRLQAQKMMLARAEKDKYRPRKRCLGQDDLAVYQQQTFKRFREEAVVTNVFSMVQESSQPVAGTGGPMPNADWPRCTMRRYYA